VAVLQNAIFMLRWKKWDISGWISLN